MNGNYWVKLSRGRRNTLPFLTIASKREIVRGPGLNLFQAYVQIVRGKWKEKWAILRQIHAPISSKLQHSPGQALGTFDHHLYQGRNEFDRIAWLGWGILTGNVVWLLRLDQTYGGCLWSEPQGACCLFGVAPWNLFPFLKRTFAFLTAKALI